MRKDPVSGNPMATKTLHAIEKLNSLLQRYDEQERANAPSEEIDALSNTINEKLYEIRVFLKELKSTSHSLKNNTASPDSATASIILDDLLMSDFFSASEYFNRPLIQITEVLAPIKRLMAEAQTLGEMSDHINDAHIAHLVRETTLLGTFIRRYTHEEKNDRTGSGAENMLGASLSSFKSTNQALAKVQDSVAAYTSGSYKSIVSNTERVKRFMLTGSLAVIVLIISISYLMARALTKPLTALTSQVRQISHQNSIDLSPLPYADGFGELSKSFIKMANDIKRYTQALKSARQYSEDVIEAISDLVFVITGNGIIQDANLAAQTKLDCDRNSLIGKDITHFIEGSNIQRTIFLSQK